MGVQYSKWPIHIIEVGYMKYLLIKKVKHKIGV